MNKPHLKSKTIRGILTVIVIVIMNILGVGEEKIGETYDTVTDATGQKTEAAKDIGLLAGAAFAYYGRTQAGKDRKDDE